MALSPLEVQKARFPQKMRGYDPVEVESFLHLVAEEMTLRLQQLEKLEREVSYYRHRLEQAEQREHQLQETLVRAQKVADEITGNARQEAQLIVREAEMTADKIVNQALTQATKIEGKIQELRNRRKEAQMKLKNTLDLFREILHADIEEERSTATVRTLPRNQSKTGA